VLAVYADGRTSDTDPTATPHARGIVIIDCQRRSNGVSRSKSEGADADGSRSVGVWLTMGDGRFGHVLCWDVRAPKGVRRRWLASLGFIPLDGALKAFLEADFRPETELTFRTTRVKFATSLV